MAEGDEVSEKWMDSHRRLFRREILTLFRAQAWREGLDEAQEVHRNSILQQIALKFETPVDDELLHLVSLCHSSDRLYQISIWLIQVDTVGELKAKFMQEFESCPFR